MALAFVFPGQGSQAPGMGRDLAAAFPAAREVFQEAGKDGFLGMAVPEKFGGGGVDDFRFNQVLDEQIAYAGIGGAGLGISLHNDICLPYFLTYCTPEQQQRWLPGIASGEVKATLALTESNGRWDESGIEATATKSGDGYAITGEKMFVLDGHTADLIIVAAKSDAGTSLFTVQADASGLTREALSTMEATTWSAYAVPL